jgi:hypothetical protein
LILAGRSLLIAADAATFTAAAAAAAAGCMSCEEFLMELCEVKHGRTFVKRGGGGRRGRGRGRGRGRRGRGRGRGKDVDPRMTFDRF